MPAWPRDDPRVKAAVQWIEQHYDLSANPGMGQAGLYYYYHLFAKALDAAGFREVVDAAGKKHDWRRDLVDELFKRQRPDGSWVNQDPRWLEGEPSLVTGYVLLALSYCKPAADEVVRWIYWRDCHDRQRVRGSIAAEPSATRSWRKSPSILLF